MTHGAKIHWQRDGQPFIDNRYSRRHRWVFDGGVEVAASSSPQAVPLPLSSADAVDPEEAFVAALASCHMLWFLSLAAKRGFCVDEYNDEAEGILARGADGRTAITKVTLRPLCQWSGQSLPTVDDIAALHHEAHERCFIANSVKSEVRCEPRG